MSQRPQFGCACCTPGMLPLYEHNPDAWQALLAHTHQATPLGPQSSVIFVGGTIYPDPQRLDLTVDAIGIANGMVIASGKIEDVREAMKPHPYVVRELVGEETLLPGLIDPHAHLMSSALIHDWTDLSPISNQYLDNEYDIEQIKAKICAAARKVQGKDPEEQWVTGFGVDPSLMREWTDIVAKTLDELPEIGPDVKIFLLNASGHISYANTLALKAAGLAEQFPTGVLTEQQSAQMLKALPALGQEQLLANLQKVFREANQRGITTLFDASIGLFKGPQEVDMMRQLAQTSSMTLRVGCALYGNDNNLMTWVDCYKPELASDANSLFTLRAIKLIADGSNQGLTGLQSEPYHCCNEHQVPGVGAYGLFNYSPVRQLAHVMQIVTSAGWPILTHANGDEAISNVLSAYQLALCTIPSANDPLPKPPFPTEPAWAWQRHRIEHCSLLHDDAIGQMKRMAISPSFLIGHVGYWGQAFQSTILGEERANLLDRCASALKGGLRISLHSDRFVTPFGPLRYMEQAITRVMEASGEVLNKDECLDVGQALRAVTIDAAWQCHLDHQIGSLLDGKQADLVVLAKNPLKWQPEDRVNMRDILVEETWVSGRKVYSGVQ